MAIGKSRPEKCQHAYFQKVEKQQKKQHFFLKSTTNFGVSIAFLCWKKKRCTQ